MVSVPLYSKDAKDVKENMESIKEVETNPDGQDIRLRQGFRLR